MHRIDRRMFLGSLLATGFARAALAGPGARVVGYLSGGATADEIAAAMARRGYVVGQDLRFEVRSRPEMERESTARAAAELVSLRPDVLMAFGDLRVEALAAATRTIPIVCGSVPDPVGTGLARSLRHPGGNVTGLSSGWPEAAGVTVDTLLAMIPKLRRVGAIYPPDVPGPLASKAYADAVRSRGLEWIPMPVTSAAQVEGALRPLENQAVFATLFPAGDLRPDEILRVASRRRIAIVGGVKSGALMFYQLHHNDPTGRFAAVLDKVLRGANPGDIPFELPDLATLSLNRSAARALGITIPQHVLLRATEIVD